MPFLFEHLVVGEDDGSTPLVCWPFEAAFVQVLGLVLELSHLLVDVATEVLVVDDATVAVDVEQVLVIA